MTSIYKGLNFHGLLHEVKNHGFSTKEEDIVEAQDVVARASTVDMIEFCNDSAWQDVAYFVLFKIWNWEDAVRFYNMYSNKTVMVWREKSEKLTGIENENDKLKKTIEQYREENNRAVQEIFEKDVEIQKKDLEIMKLKAKLYDMMNPEEPKAKMVDFALSGVSEE